MNHVGSSLEIFVQHDMDSLPSVPLPLPPFRFVSNESSKKLTEAKREEIYEALTGHPDVLWAA